MKKNIRNEESFIFAIYNERHNVNELLLALPFILVIFYSIIGVPIIRVMCDIQLVFLPLLLFGPIICVLAFYLIRKKIIINKFIKVKDISGKVEETYIQSENLEKTANGKVFVFEYSEYMKVILYNWLLSLNVLKNGKLKMNKVIYDDYAPVCLAVCESDLDIPEEAKERYEKETRKLILLAYMVNGKVVNQKLYSGIAKNS